MLTAEKGMKPDDLNSLNRIFNSMDTDHDNALSIEEMKEAMIKCNISRENS